MVDFLLKRPIAVLMAFLAVVILGCITFVTLPVSLLPDVAIPHITVQVSEDNASARELENSVVAPLRRQLLQVNGLSELKSETRDGSAVINLTMDYGVSTDLAFIEVNEKIDGAMNSLPKTLSRPKAIKASATDIPVLYINMTGTDDNEQFLEISEVAENTVRRRFEQLPEVAMVDVTGVPGKQLRIVPDYVRMASAGITVSEIESALSANNAEPASMTVHDGYYEYNIHISNQLTTPQDVKNVQLMKNQRIYSLGDFCDVALVENTTSGYSLYGGHRAVTMAVIKQASESMDNMERAVDTTLKYFTEQYPQIKFSKSRNQTELLDYTISNLEQNLILGLILVFVVCALFMRDMRLPFIIGITIIVTIVITFLLFYFFHVSLNIISLAGLILAVGMMIDNSVIVAENITQFRHAGHPLYESCVKGTNEMITPMLSSSLTTVAVFVPLVFMSGIAGAIFADQAFSITAGLAASYIVGITLLPVLYNLMARKEYKPTPDGMHTKWYDKGVDWIFSHKAITVAGIVVVLLGVVPMFRVLDIQRMPTLDSAETIMHIDWNENINIDENRRRVDLLTTQVKAAENSAYIGMQDFMLANSGDLSASEAEVYFRAENVKQLQLLKDSLTNVITAQYPNATIEYTIPENVFEKVFSSDEPPLEARFTVKTSDARSIVDKADRLQGVVVKATNRQIQPLPLRQQINITPDNEKMALYNVNASDVQRTLLSAFKGSNAATLRSYQDYIPVNISDNGQSLDEVLSTTLVRGKSGKDGVVNEVPLNTLVKTSRSSDFKSIMATGSGEYIPMPFDCNASQSGGLMNKVREATVTNGDFDVNFTGSIFSNQKMMNELIIILLVSMLMMYFILCAQFESFVQPLIVLVEIPIDIFFALVFLWMFGQTLNLMSAIGIVVSCGIVVNDTILKLDAINELRKAGTPLLKAIHTAGQRRLKAIIMTSLTTIFAMVPVLFTSDMGSELQRPLAVAIIGSMIVGTMVSVFIIPLVYRLVYYKQS
jgi:multidrug efflux pump subunit AcrB